MAAYQDLRPGDTAPGFIQRCSTNDRYVFDSAAGRHLVLCFFGSSSDDHAQAAMRAMEQRTDLFDDRRACFFGVTMDPADQGKGESDPGRVRTRIPGYRYFWDDDGLIGKLYGALPRNANPQGKTTDLRPRWVLIDRTFRVVDMVPFAEDRSDIERIIALTEEQTRPEVIEQNEVPAPILILPRVFEPELCQELLDYSAKEQLNLSGFMVEEAGQTVLKVDVGYKSRKDCEIRDDRLKEKIRMRVVRSVIPQIKKAFQYDVTRIERYMIGCYTDEDAGFFDAHRDNTTRGTAHRRFALTIALNDDYEGGGLRFPEYGKRTYKPPAGGAVVFSCSLLHEVLPMERGERYVVVPFLYDDAAAKLRERNLKYIKR